MLAGIDVLAYREEIGSDADFETFRGVYPTRGMVQADTFLKKDRSPVTIADYGSQALVARMLERTFPGDPMVGEESSEALRAGGQEELRSRVMAEVRRAVPQATEREVLAWIDRGSARGGRQLLPLAVVEVRATAPLEERHDARDDRADHGELHQTPEEPLLLLNFHFFGHRGAPFPVEARSLSDGTRYHPSLPGFPRCRGP